MVLLKSYLFNVQIQSSQRYLPPGSQSMIVVIHTLDFNHEDGVHFDKEGVNSGIQKQSHISV